MTDELLKLKWNGHLSSFLQIFQSLRSKARYTDVTLACEGRLFTVHRLVLASCSQFFDHIFEQTPAENTVIILNEAKACDIEALLDYMYCGQVDVHQSNLASFIRTAKCLQIKGLATPEIADNFNKGKRSRDVDGDACPKKKRSEPPSVPPLPTGLYLRHSDENPSVTNSPSPTSANSALQHPRWVFQRSDLPNTTWSSSQAGAGDGEGKGEPFCSSSPYAEEVLVGDDCIPSKSSPHPQMEARRLTQHNYPLIPENKPPNSSYATTPELVYRGSGDYHDENVQQIKSEVKEEQKDAAVDESENFSNSDYSSQNYSYLNTYDREDSSECFSNSIPFRSNAFDNQPTGEAHNSFNQSRISYPLSLVKEVPATTSQATVSPKLMPYAKCSNCLTNNTKLWRRSIKGEIVCNACGLYYKLHGVNRPSHLFRNAPMTRRRNPRKKKKLYEEIAEGREHNVLEDKNDSLHNESGCDDSDTQDGLAVLNAALTLNSLFAKAKAQEAAAAAAAAKSQGDLRPPQGLSLTTTAERSTNSSITLAGSILQNDADPPSNADSRPPPPPLLKLHHTPRNSPPHLHPYPSFSHQKGGFVDDGRGRGGDETPVVST